MTRSASRGTPAAAGVPNISGRDSGAGAACSTCPQRLIGKADVMAASLPPVTPESIAEAKYACWRERRAVYEATGVRILADGRIELPQAVQVRHEPYAGADGSAEVTVGRALGQAIGRLLTRSR